jgi:hypothetical protein
MECYFLSSSNFDVIMYEYKQQSHISKRKVLLAKSKKHAERTITTCVGQWRTKYFG